MPSQVNLDPLYNPVLAPAPLGEAPQQAPVYAPAGGFTPTQQNLNSTLAGTQPGTVTPGYGGGGATVTPPVFSTEDISTVGGVTGLAPQDTKTFIPELGPTAEELAGEEIDRQITDFEAADKIGGRGEARKAKTKEREADQAERKAEHDKAKEEYKAMEAGSEKRKARRRARGKRRSSRKSERESRKDAWRTYKGKDD